MPEKDVRPLPLTIGGPMDPDHVVGRDAAVKAIFGTLDSTSVVLTGERRMGKTSLARVVERDARRDGWTVVWQSAEGFTTINQFTEALAGRFEAAESRLSRAMRTVRKRWKLRAGPFEVDPDHAPRLLDEVVAAAVGAVDGRLLLVLDELPILARELEARRSGDGTAALHLLRRLRQDHAESLRMLCLGSVGFHHVVRGGQGVLNDLDRHRLGPLATDDGAYLAACLMRGADVAADDEDEVAMAVAAAVESVPYYVQRLVGAARLTAGRSFSAEQVPALVTAAIEGPDDRWDLRHYRDRIAPYYDSAGPIAAAVLDALAHDAEGLALPEVESRVAADPLAAPVDRERLRDVLERLEEDHYLVREGERRRFAFSLVRRAWIHNRS